MPSVFSLASTTSLATLAIMGEPWMRLYSTIARMFSCARSPEYSPAIESKTSFLTRCWAEQIALSKNIVSSRFMAERIQSAMALVDDSSPARFPHQGCRRGWHPAFSRRIPVLNEGEGDLIWQDAIV